MGKYEQELLEELGDDLDKHLERYDHTICAVNDNFGKVWVFMENASKNFASLNEYSRTLAAELQDRFSTIADTLRSLGEQTETLHEAVLQLQRKQADREPESATGPTISKDDCC